MSTEHYKNFIEMFSRQPVELVRLALNMPQIEELSPPPNPAKTTDSRFQQYQRRFGEDSWELDALPPTYLEKLVEGEIRERIDQQVWGESLETVANIQKRIRNAAKGF